MLYENIKELQKVFPNAKFGIVDVYRKWKKAIESEPWYGDFKVFDDGDWQINLPHCCDEWDVGNADEAEKLAMDLLKAARHCKLYLTAPANFNDVGDTPIDETN